MKNIYYYLMIGAVTATTFFSCNNSDELSVNEEPVNINQEDDLIARNILNISSDDAFKLAKRFYKDEYAKESRTASTVNVKDIQTVTSESGEPLMYIVNYADNKGYTIISATKNYTPVLAYSETGNMDAQNSTFLVNPFINEYKSRIESVVNVESDSLRQRYALDWSFYEEKPIIVESRYTYTDAEIQQKLAAARTYYTNQGYEVHSLGAITSLMTALNGQTAEQRANAFINDICFRIPPQYDCMDVTLLLYKRTDEVYGYYLNTAWKQGTPYNYGSTYGHAGCNTIAIGQMMNYYKWPNIYDWYNISGDWIGHTNDLHPSRRELITDIRTELNLVETPDGVEVSKPNMVNALIHFGYLVEQQNYTDISMINKIKSGIPVMVYGQSETDVHVWICDGYRNIETQYATYMMSHDFEDFAFFPGTTDHLGEYFHLNLGTGSNGWYYIEEVPYGNLNYVNNRVMYTLTKNYSLYD